MCTSKTQRRNWIAGESRYVYDYEFSAVTGTSEENNQFFASTPNGLLKMTAVRDDLFDPGTAY